LSSNGVGFVLHIDKFITKSQLNEENDNKKIKYSGALVIILGFEVPILAVA
jgi:hypothetical protein